MKSANLPAPGIIAADPATARTTRLRGISVADLEAALEQFREIEEDMNE